ncbi:MAG: GyrI-like domain-containing protein [Hamadaea sp.]|nr:GyrI-like domain-containing protein [Hamadaea sp.]NUT03689.1 GyrI-like domain-containing protein [Hamadaea sp.]
MTGIEVEQREPQSVVSVRQSVAIAELTQAQGASLHELWGFLRERGIKPAGPPFVRYHTFGDDETDLEVGVPVVDAVAGRGQVTAGELPGGRVVVTIHEGGHDRLAEAYARLQEGVVAHGSPAGPAWEVYEWIDLTTQPDVSAWPAPADWRTQLIQPIS